MAEKDVKGSEAQRSDLVAAQAALECERTLVRRERSKLAEENAALERKRAELSMEESRLHGEREQLEADQRAFEAKRAAFQRSRAAMEARPSAAATTAAVHDAMGIPSAASDPFGAGAPTTKPFAGPALRPETMKLALVAAGVALVVVLAWLIWPSADNELQADAVPTGGVVSAPAAGEPGEADSAHALGIDDVYKPEIPDIPDPDAAKAATPRPPRPRPAPAPGATTSPPAGTQPKPGDKKAIDDLFDF